MRMSARRPLDALLRDRRGVAAAEFSIVAVLMLVLAIAAYDIGGAVAQYMRLAEAVRAGGQYALSYPTQLTSASSCPATSLSSPAAPTSAACAMTQALPSGWTDVTTSISCTCVGSSSTTTTTSCSSVSNCGSSATQRYVTLEASRAFSSILPPAIYAFTPLSNTSVSYVVRIQ